MIRLKSIFPRRTRPNSRRYHENVFLSRSNIIHKRVVNFHPLLLPSRKESTSTSAIARSRYRFFAGSEDRHFTALRVRSSGSIDLGALEKFAKQNDRTTEGKRREEIEETVRFLRASSRPERRRLMATTGDHHTPSRWSWWCGHGV